MGEEKLKLCIIVPAYNEAPVIAQVLESLPTKLAPFTLIETIVIDDGSDDGTGRIARDSGFMVLRHSINRGLGGALGTGFEAAFRRKADVIITFDADGQHRPEDIENLVKPILNKTADVVIGSRMLDREGMPKIRIVLNWFANLLTYSFFRIKVTDSQSGLRALSSDAAGKISIRTNRMEVSSEFLAEVARNKLKLTEVPIPAIYTEYSLQKGQKNINGLYILFKLILRKLMR